MLWTRQAFQILTIPRPKYGNAAGAHHTNLATDKSSQLSLRYWICTLWHGIGIVKSWKEPVVKLFIPCRLSMWLGKSLTTTVKRDKNKQSFYGCFCFRPHAFAQVILILNTSGIFQWYMQDCRIFNVLAMWCCSLAPCHQFDIFKYQSGVSMAPFQHMVGVLKLVFGETVLDTEL